MKVKNDLAVNFQLKRLERRSLKKNHGFNGIRTINGGDSSMLITGRKNISKDWP